MLIVHTADIHIGVENYGRPDPVTKTSTRLVDFLGTLDEVVTFASENSADIVLFCGDAYKSRNPNQTHQREFAKRIYSLANNGIQVFLLIGNHDSPNIPGPASALDIFPTLNIPNVHIGSTLTTHLIETKSGPIQIVSLPWVRKGQFMSSANTDQLSTEELNSTIQSMLTTEISYQASNLDPDIPSILSGHVSIDSARTSSEKSMMLGNDYVLLKSSVALPQFDYVALGHIHKYQLLNETPKVVYPGSLQRIDFGEEKDVKGFCSIHLDPTKKTGQRETSYEFIPVNARRMVTIKITLDEIDPEPTNTIITEIKKHNITDAIAQVMIEVPALLYDQIDDTLVKESLSSAHLIATIRKNVVEEKRQRLSHNPSGDISPVEALKSYLNARDIPKPKANMILEKGTNLIEEHSNPESVN